MSKEAENQEETLAVNLRQMLAVSPVCRPPVPAPMPPRLKPFRPTRFHQSPRGQARMVFYRGLSATFQAGVPLTRSLQLLASQCENLHLRKALGHAARALDGGKSLSAALGETPDCFGATELALIRAGEESGSLPQVLERLAAQAESSQRTVARARAALLNPALTLAACLTLLTLVPAFAFQDLFRFLQELHTPLPWNTRLVMAAMNWFGSPAGLLSLAVLAGTAWKLRGRAEPLLLRLPGAGSILRAAAVAETASSLASMYNSGVPLLKALDLCAESAAIHPLRAALREARVQVGQGFPFHQALLETGQFPKSLIHMLKAGEESGQVGDMLQRAATYARESTEAAVTAGLATLEPLALSLVGTLVGFLLLSIMAPMVKVAQAL